MDNKEFNKLASQGFNRIPIVLEAYADLDTPLSVYLKLADGPYSYLLESVQGGERFGRYSFIGLPAKTRFEVRGKQCFEINQDRVISEMEVDDPLDWITQQNERFKVALLPGLPRFLGGLVGYFGYETVQYIEKKVGTNQKPDVLDTPDILLLLSDELAIVDNLSGKLYLVIYADPSNDSALLEAENRLKSLHDILRTPITDSRKGSLTVADPVSEFSERKFVEAVKRIKNYIIDGEAMQVVLSQRMKSPFPASPLALYRALRTLNPSPYMFYFDMGDFNVIGASPEILVRLENGIVTLRPIAGTRPRGSTREHDIALEKELLADPKEIAEHVMLMDLGRNDLGRVAEIGTIKVTDKMIVERYSHVMHIVSNVEGRLKEGLDAMSVLKATFPAGTVSGAPKVRAMQIIEELESTKRGVYSGAVGYIGFNGDMDLAIAIRTAVVKDGMLYVQAGAGIVADSVPLSEWVETQNKAKAILRAAEMALKGLGGDIL